MHIEDTYVTISLRHNNAIIIKRHTPRGPRSTLTDITLTHRLSALNCGPLCLHLTTSDLDILGPITETFPLTRRHSSQSEIRLA